MNVFRNLLFICLCSLPASLAHADQQWIEVTTQHFSVMTDGGEKRAREVATRFEQMRMAFGIIFQKVSVNTAPLEIVAFRNSKEMRQYAPLYQGKPIEVAGLYLGDAGHGGPSNFQERQYIALDLSGEDNWETVFHEYAHLLINSNVAGNTPLWFDEGFAEYCSSLKVDKKEIALGLARNDLLYTLSENSWLKLVDLFSITHDAKIYNRDDRRSLFYAQSWITVHYFMSHRMVKQVAAYIHYTQDEHQPIPDAIRHAFGMEPEQLQKTIEAYHRGGNAGYFHIAAPAGINDIAFNSRPLNDVELRTVLADLDFQTRDYRARGIAIFQDILARQPDNVVANRDLGYAALQQGDWDKAEQYFKRAAAADSKDPEVHYLVAFGLSRKARSSGGLPEDLETMKKELNTAITLDPNYADAYGLLGMLLVSGDDKESAIATLKKAIALNPRYDWNYANLANVYMRAQDFDSAVPLFQQLTSSSDPQISSMAQQQLQSIETYKQNLARWKEQSAARGGNSTVSTDEDQPDSAQPAAKLRTGSAKSEPVLFMKGILNAVDCSTSPSAVLMITSGGKKWKMLAPDAKKVVMIGADSLSCSWTNKKVAVNYRKTGVNEGQLVTVELE